MKPVHHVTIMSYVIVITAFAVLCASGVDSTPTSLSDQLIKETIKPAELSSTMLQTIFKNMQAEYDPEFGGFGSPSSPKGTKLYHPSALDFLLVYYDQTGDASALDMVQKTLSAMADGGVYDQLGGGFFYYALDGQWRVPDFEKKSYDNAELLQVYTHAYQATGREEFASVARGIIAYTMRELADKQHGGFYTSQGSEKSANDDADYYTWTRAEVRAVLPPDQAELVEAYYDIRASGEVKQNRAKNVLFVATSPEQIAKGRNLRVQAVEQTIESAREKLLVTRNQRPAPAVDTSIIVASNSMCISAFLEASIVFDDPSLREFALKTLDRLTRDAYRKGQGMSHTVDNSAPLNGATLDDEVFFAQACIDAYQVSGEKRYVELARELIDFCLAKYWVPAPGGFLDRQFDPATTAPLHVEHMRFDDSPTPSGNSMAALVLEHLALITSEERYHEKALQIVSSYAGAVKTGAPGSSLGTYATAFAMILHSPPKVAIVGSKHDSRTQTLWQKALATYRPGKLVAVYDPTTDKDILFPPAKDGSPLVYVCAGDVCYPPVRTVDKMVKLIQTAGR